ncbi:hypothetical protein BOTCAL_0374g00040 [Botryotinia calthae]|uniref:Uncharacterized protein n=1 Tax=Botryotinia calthae TaxID=38488 RepID=A0A4Y8CSF3_9HELO|nr:hypothetical protein BOTCAL_0374g00040 [Botryotinia calthae]
MQDLAQPHTILKPPSKPTIQNGTPERRYRTIQQLDIVVLGEVLPAVAPTPIAHLVFWQQIARKHNDC